METHERYKVTKLGRNCFSQPDKTAKEGPVKDYCPLERKAKFETGLSFESRRLEEEEEEEYPSFIAEPRENSSRINSSATREAPHAI